MNMLLKKWPEFELITGKHLCRGYSIFDSGLYRSLSLKWLFPQEKATLYDLSMATSESKML
jgi:hypothetical protein